MTITEKTIKILWSNAGGRCSFPDCSEKLTIGTAGQAAPHTLGEMAHIKGKRTGSNRYDQDQNSNERDDYENLILLCPNHHNLIDKPENEDIYSVNVLYEMKVAHENFVNSRLDENDYADAEEVKKLAAIYLSENHQAWLMYGPQSEAAQKNPNSDEIYAVWLSERLSTIVPNNRYLVKVLENNRELFDTEDQPVISRFLSHAKSYQKWVNNEIPYQAVLRFPQEFEELIKGT